MTKEQIEKAIARVIAEREEFLDAIEDAENELEEDFDEDLLTPQSHLDYLHEQADALLEEYNELCEALRTA